jgi:dimethylglycine dehydrogenase
VTIANVSETIGILGLMGPKSRDILARLTEADLKSGFRWLSVRDIVVADRPVRALRVSYIGELGWELHMPVADLPHVFDAIVAAGKPQGLGFYGAYAANSMRLEKGYRAWGSDLTTERSPIESGLSYLVKPKGRDFVGRTAMLEKPAPWRMVLLNIETTDVDPFYAHPVYCGGKPVGIVTSGAFGHRTGLTLALAYLREAEARDGLTVRILGQDRTAEILDRPPFDPENLRLKS